MAICIKYSHFIVTFCFYRVPFSNFKNFLGNCIYFFNVLMELRNKLCCCGIFIFEPWPAWLIINGTFIVILTRILEEIQTLLIPPFTTALMTLNLFFSFVVCHFLLINFTRFDSKCCCHGKLFHNGFCFTFLCSLRCVLYFVCACSFKDL